MVSELVVPDIQITWPFHQLNITWRKAHSKHVDLR